MNGVGKIKLQFLVTFVQSLLHIPFAIFLGRIYGIYGIVFVMFFCSFLFFPSFCMFMCFRSYVFFRCLYKFPMFL